MQISRINETKARELHSLGKSDEEMGLVLDVHPKSIARWRRKRKLASNNRGGKEIPTSTRTVNPLIDTTKANELHNEGKMDTEIAKLFGVKLSDIRFWREVEGLPSNQGIKEWQQKRCRQCDQPCKLAISSGSRCWRKT